MTFIPLPERSGIDHNNGVLDQGLGSDQLVVGCIVDDIDDTRLTGDTCKRSRLLSTSKGFDFLSRSGLVREVKYGVHHDSDDTHETS